MKITVTNNNIVFTSIMKLTFAGYFIGMALIAIPFILLDIGNMSENTDLFMAFVIIPTILLAQALLLGLVINFGLFIYRWFRPIEVEFSGSK